MAALLGVPSLTGAVWLVVGVAASSAAASAASASSASAMPAVPSAPAAVRPNAPVAAPLTKFLRETLWSMRILPFLLRCRMAADNGCYGGPMPSHMLH